MKRTQTMVAILSFLIPAAASAEDTPPPPFTCAAPPAPVVSLDHGSRYVDEDDSRSEFDPASNEEVDAQLKPVDSFITDMSLAANLAVSTPEDRAAAASCVLSGLVVWAKADALGDLATMNAQLSAPSRIAGLAFAYAQVRPFLSAPEDQAVVDGWLSARALATMTYFESDAPKNASRNNLRAWAGLAVARIGLTVGDATMTDWADASVRLVACQAAADGSLPLEMARQDLALHYQLHAITPLVVTAALLEGSGHDLFSACDRALQRTVSFALAALDDPTPISDLTGHVQSYFNGTEELRGFELAWAEAYLAHVYSPPLETFVAGYEPLSNSKIGGRQSLLWQRKSDPALPIPDGG